MNIRFATKYIGAVGRVTLGVKGINLNEGDEVITALPVHKDTDTVGIFTSNGLGKKISLKEFVVQTRGGKGTICSKNPVVGALMLSDEDNILISGNTTICFSAKDVPLLSKIAEGNIMSKATRITSVAKI